MSDRFIYEAMPHPRPEFADALWGKLSELHRSRRSSAANAAWHPSVRPSWKLAVGGLVVLLAVVAAVPAFRAAALQMITTIAGIEFEETADYPYEGPVEYNELHLDLDAARAGLSYLFELPTWAPEGYVLQRQTLILLSPDELDISAATNIYVYWLDAQGNNLILIAQPPELADCPGCLVPMGTASSSEVSVNGLPAALTRGAWNVETETWDENGMISLRWYTDEALYMLTAVESSVPEDQLMRVAESIPDG